MRQRALTLWVPQVRAMHGEHLHVGICWVVFGSLGLRRPQGSGIHTQSGEAKSLGRGDPGSGRRLRGPSLFVLLPKLQVASNDTLTSNFHRIPKSGTDLRPPRPGSIGPRV